MFVPEGISSLEMGPLTTNFDIFTKAGFSIPIELGPDLDKFSTYLGCNTKGESSFLDQTVTEYWRIF
jgi:hypothetical protein